MPVVAINPYEVLINGVEVDKAELQALLAEINVRLGGIVLTPANVDVGTMVVYGDDGLGPAPASEGVRPISCAGRQLGYFGPLPVDIDGNTSLTNALHHGCLLRKKTTAAAVLTMDLHPDPTVGIADNFSCTLLRYPGSGGLQIVSGLNNQHPALHTRIVEGGMATIYVDGVDGGWFLKGETEV